MLCATVLLLSLALMIGCRSAHPTVGTIPNFGIVDAQARIYRGGEPIAPEGWTYLKSLGVQTVLKLNTETESKDTGAEAVELTIVRLPISKLEQTVGSPKTATVKSAVDVMSRGAVFVHCGSDSRSKPHSLAARLDSQGGQDRTGLVVAAYRVWVGHWTKERAQMEMMSFHFHPLLAGLANFWRDEVK